MAQKSNNKNNFAANGKAQVSETARVKSDAGSKRKKPTLSSSPQPPLEACDQKPSAPVEPSHAHQAAADPKTGGEQAAHSADLRAESAQVSMWLKVGVFLVFVMCLRDGWFDSEKQRLERLIKLKEREWKLNRVEPLLSYVQFRQRYPLAATTRPARAFSPSPATEHSHRYLLFNMDLIAVSRQNLAYIARKESYTLRQSPFRSDRTASEQRDVLGQLDEFDLDKILSTLRREEEQAARLFDSALSGLPPPPQQPESGGELERASRLNVWLTRVAKGDAHFEIPSFPLSAQPDANRVTHIDADLRHCAGDIQDQRACGACYAFAWSSFAAWHYCAQSGQQIDFSEQHIVDCGHLARLRGCQDGYLTDVRAFSHAFGFELERDYPYKAKQAKQCKRPEGSVKVRTLDFRRLQVERAQWERVLQQQPILLEVHLPSDIASYKRGVHPGHNCDAAYAHGMLLVGHGRQNGQPYWLLKNSMGRSWGENGYLRLSRDADMKRCFRTGFVSKFKFQQLDQEAFYNFYDQITFEPTEQRVEPLEPRN